MVIPSRLEGDNDNDSDDLSHRDHEYIMLAMISVFGYLMI